MIKFRIISPLELNFNFRILRKEEFTNGYLVRELFFSNFIASRVFFLKCLLTKGDINYDINHTPFVSWQSKESKAM